MKGELSNAKKEAPAAVNLTIRPTTPADLEGVMAIIEEARRTIAALGIDQWQKGSPNRTHIETDLALGQSFVVTADVSAAEVSAADASPAETSAHGAPSDGDVPVATFALLRGGEPTYGVIEGAWLTPGWDGAGNPTYIAIHRVAVSVARRGTGVSTAMLNYAEYVAREAGRISLRIDTHHGNVVMRRMLEKHGFIPCGTIHLEDGDPRVAYEKLL